MKSIGLLLIVLGLAVGAVSFILFGTSVTRAMAARQVASIPLTLNHQTITDPVTLDTDRFGQVSIYLDIQGDSVHEETRFDETEYKLRYRFPVRYEVSDRNDQVLISETTTASWDSGGIRTGSGQNIDIAGGTAAKTHHFGKFKPPANGQVRVKVTVESDNTYGAKARMVELRLHDNVSKQAGRVAGAFMACCSGPALVLAGLVILIMGLVGVGGKRR